MSGDAAAHFREVAASHQRCFWLDGGGAREWSGKRSMIGRLDDDDVSLTYDAARGEVTRHGGGEQVVVGSDPFAVLEAELASGPDDAWWCGYFGYAARSDLPARPDARRLPDAVWMRVREVEFFTHPDASAAQAGAARSVPSGSALDEVPPAYAAAYAQVQEELRAGNSYEVNLTYRVDVAAEVDPVTAYLRLRELNPAPYQGFLQHDVPGARAWLLSSSPERYALVGADRTLETKPIKGTTPRGRLAPGRRRAAGPAGRGPQDPRREPDDRRPAPQRPVDGVRAGLGARAGADGGGVLPGRPPARLDRARSAGRRRDDAGRAAGAVPGRAR